MEVDRPPPTVVFGDAVETAGSLIAERGFANHWLENVPSEVYHADRTSVSSTGLRRLLKSARTFRSGLDNPPEETDAMRFGTLVHQVVLEGHDFLKRYVVMPEFVGLTQDGRESARSGAAKAKREAWLNEQALARNIIVTQEEFDTIRGMLDSVLEHDDATALLKNGVTEVSGYYRDPETGIRCRLRPDYMNFNLMALVDLKTTRDCSAEAFAKTIWDFRYDFQLAMYGAGAEAICGKRVEYHAFVTVEKTRPYECAVYVADDAMLAKGREDYHRSLAKLRQCLDSGKWGRYQASMQTIGLPFWATR